MRAGRRTQILAATITLLSGLLVMVPAAHAVDTVTVTPGYDLAYAGDAPDPDVVRVGNTYYTYTTGTSWGNHIGILKSSSPNTGYVTLTGIRWGSSAFPKLDQFHAPASWQINNTSIAPGVFHWNGHWMMYYSAQAKATHQWCLSIATANSPAGPFTDGSARPWFCMDASGGVVDPDPFVDNNGRPWLYFKTNTGSVFAPAHLWAVPLDGTGRRMLALPQVLLTQDTLAYPWETTIENPQMISHGGSHYLFYSGGQWDSINYGENYAWCQTAAGPCMRLRGTPMLMQYGTVLGPGGATAFRDAAGKWWMAYHAWNWPCVTYGCGGQRKLYVQPLHFGGSSCVAPRSPAGYRMAAADGGVFSFGGDPYCGSTAGLPIRGSVAAVRGTHTHGGYWLAGTDGSVYAFGNAEFYGSAGYLGLNQPIVGMAGAPDDHGYWLVARDGAVFAYGTARFRGSKGGQPLNQPIVGMASTPDGKGYWLVARDGGIFAFGSARFHGSTGAKHLNQPIVGMASTPDGKGYWLVARDGGIFTFGTARFYGSTGGKLLNQPILGMMTSSDGKGYRLVARDGGIFTFGSARYRGSMGGTRLTRPIVGID
jgi:hypothetical protein